MTWTCEQIETRLSDYVDRLLEAGERKTFEAHVAGCARCAPLVSSVSGFVAGLHRMEPLEAPPRLVYNILDKTIGPRTEKAGWRAWFGWTRALIQPRFAYGALTVLITLAVVSQALGIEWRKPTLADLNPVNIYRSADRRAHLVYAKGVKFVTDLRVVYEIQSRLRPENEPQAQPEKKPAPGQSEGEPSKSPRELNRARERQRFASVLACTLGSLPGRSLQ